MTNVDLQQTWHNAMNEVLQGFRTKLSELGIPIVEGTLRGGGHTLIECDIAFLDQHEGLLRQPDSLSVIEVQYNDAEQEPRSISGLAVYVRIGATTTWLYATISLPQSQDESDDDDDEDELEEAAAPDSSTLSGVALSAAEMSQFGSLKNKAQREAMILSLLKKQEFSHVPDYYAAEITSRAEGLYEFGVLPQRARALSQQGKSVAEIAKALGLTKQRAERALATETPEFIAEMLQAFPLPTAKNDA